MRLHGLGAGAYEVVLQAFQGGEGVGALVVREARGREVLESAPVPLHLPAQGVAGRCRFDERGASVGGRGAAADEAGLFEAADRAAGAGDPQALQFRFDAAQCLEQLGEAAALTEYRAVLPYYENGQSAFVADPARAFDVRRRIGLLLLTTGDHAAGHQQLHSLHYDTERAYGPYHALAVDLRRALDRQQMGRLA